MAFHLATAKKYFWYVLHAGVDYGAEMTPKYFISIIEGWKDHFSQLVTSTSPAEIVVAVALPLLALLIGIRINRYIDSKPNHTLPAKAIDIMAPLISPVLAFLFVSFAGLLLVSLDIKPLVLPFVAKLSVAWFAVQLVMTISSGRSASLFIMLVILPITLLHLFGIWDASVAFMNELSFTFGAFKFNLYAVLKAIIIIIIMMWVVNLMLNTTESRLRKVRTMRASNRTLILKFMQIGLYVAVFLFALNLLGVSLTALSVLGGAIGVGIGFGLQKIASNFISGIILLFEKSIEVGDIVELEQGITGTVMHTSARYTLIGTFDGKDVLIPNEEFITQRVTSLTHSNRQGRIEVDVGISYGDNVELALKLLLEAASAHERCLSEPAPASYVTGLGESSVDLKLMFWVEDVMAGRLEPKSYVIIRMLALFKANGISIPFPHQVQIADPAFEERFAIIEAKLNGLAKKGSEPAAKDKAVAAAPTEKTDTAKPATKKPKGAVE